MRTFGSDILSILLLKGIHLYVVFGISGSCAKELGAQRDTQTMNI